MRYKATLSGSVELTPTEEQEYDALQLSWSSLDAKKKRLKERITDIRWQKETGGYYFNGNLINTEISSQGKLGNAKLMAIGNANLNFDWKTKDGQFISKTSAQLIEMYDAVSSYIQACFAAEKNHYTAVDALTEQNVDAYDITVNWPSNSN